MPHHHHGSPTEGMDKYFGEMSDVLRKYFEPYIGAGSQMMPGMMDQFGQLMNDPGAMFNKFAGGYHESPGYQFAQRQGQGAAMNAAAAGGMAGSPQHQQYATQMSEDIANQDFMNYMKSVMGMYGMGLEGGMGVSKMGQEAGMGLGEDLASIIGSRAGMEYGSRQAEQERKWKERIAKQQSDSDWWKSLFGGIGTAAGTIFGGPFGGSMGKWMFGS